MTPTNKVCDEPGCDRKVKARNKCPKHYNELRFAGQECDVDGCGLTPHALGLCAMHYERVRRDGSPGESGRRRRVEVMECRVEGCSLPAKSRRDLCGRHAARVRLYGTETGTFRTHKVCECGEPAVAGHRSSDFCREHYIEFVKGLVVAGAIEPTPSQRGYCYVSIFKKNYPVHQVVMEHALERPLLPGEEVHHKNGDRADNRPENLELWVTSQPAGQRVADLVAWVVATYPDLVREHLNTS